MEIDREELIRRALRLKEFLADEVVQQAFENLERHWYEQWKNSGQDVEMREHLFAKTSALDELRGQFAAIVDSGIVASEGTGNALDPARD